MPVEYLATIERFFVVVRRSGLMLSARDVALVQRWAAAGIPLAVACRGIALGAERFREQNGPDARLPGSLQYYRRFVEEELERRRDAAPAGSPSAEPRGARPDGAEPDPLAELAFVGREETDPRKRDAYRAAWRALRAAGHSGEGRPRPEVVATADRVAMDTFLGLLSAVEREELEADVDRALQEERKNLGTRGMEVRRRAVLEDEVSARFGLVRLGRDATAEQAR